ncbi:MFS transporter [Streptomyces kronopolitis]|uniref:MFS transporter n=1 Tax=Streptomyces kronopolitis TaxID=1612435 RepID=UPI0020BEE8AD|nr:MFS transporter [Streptomyces kronopolitis]MCL6300749.1 MFS transporter [Streptomyces kronopolitis]
MEPSHELAPAPDRPHHPRSGPSGWARRAASHVPPGRAARIFLLVAFVDAAGRGIFLAGSALFYTQVIGLTNAQVGLGLSIAGLVGLVCAVPIGWLADRFGDGPVLVALQLWRAAAFLAYPLVDDFRLFLVVACLVGAVEWAAMPIIQSVAGATGEEGSMVGAMAVVAVARNSAYALSALAATAVITWASPRVYVVFVLVNALGFLVSGLLLLRLRLPRRATDHAPRERGAKLLPFKDVRFVLLSLTNGILYAHMPILSVAFPLWIVTRTDAPRALVGVALTINTVLAVLLQIRLSKGGDDLRRAGGKQRLAGLALAVFCLLVACTRSVDGATATVLLLLAAVALTLGELWQSAGGWGISYGLAPEAQRTYYLSIYQLGATGVTVAGPAVLVMAVVDVGPAGWTGLAVLLALTGLLTPLLTRPPRHRAVPAPAAGD